ncbi:hypothetical protein QR685DRAFT_450137 [Neurospora intermedia]|uniref:Uncharacterized protein n=1 Tax=Neurospora intermedia TaxID=5142 RepID=A0ABR3D238_NEUIN
MQRCGAEVFLTAFSPLFPFPNAPIPINALYAPYQCLGRQEGEGRRKKET